MVEEKDFLSRDYVHDAVEPVEGMNRRDKRAIRRQKNVLNSIADMPPTERKTIKQSSDVFLEDTEDITVLEKDLFEYNGAQDQTKKLFQFYRLMRDCDVTEETLHKLLVPGYDKKGVHTQMNLEANPQKYKQRIGMITALGSLLSKARYKDEDEVVLVMEMDKRGYKVDEMFPEILRARGESIDLMKMQLDYLKEQQRKQKQVQEDEVSLAKMVDDEEKQRLIAEQAEEEKLSDGQIQEDSVEERVEVEEEKYSLADWELSWTDNYWSDNPNHLHRIPSADRQQIVDSLEQFARGNISISTGSVARALEFHLVSRDVIQKALATRNKYAPEEIRRWVKVKRGKDRIGILIPNPDEKRAIFFVGGRDNVYRGL